MERWADKTMDGWMDERTDGVMGVCMDRHINHQMGGCILQYIQKVVIVCSVLWIWMNGCTVKWVVVFHSVSMAEGINE